MTKNQSITLEEVITTLQNLGGEAQAFEIKDQIWRNHERKLGPYYSYSSFRETVQMKLEVHCKLSDNYRGPEYFLKTRRGRYKLINQVTVAEPPPLTPIAIDIIPPSPTERVKIEEYRILRDTELCRRIKLLHNNCCQICGLALELSFGKSYSEAHHIKPLGSLHNGPDVLENILCVCPNHHAQLDYGAISLDLTKIKTIDEHPIGQEYILYHNTKIFH